MNRSPQQIPLEISIGLLRRLKWTFARFGIRNVLARAGLLRASRNLYHRIVLRQGIYRVPLLGDCFSFRVTSAEEIRRLDAFEQEREMTARLISSLRPRDVVYDIGANIGVLTMVIGRKLQSLDGVICAFEPEPRTYERLLENIRLNELENIRAEPFALGEHEDKAELQIDGVLGAGRHRIYKGGPSGKKVLVNVCSADGFAGRTGRYPSVVKIDVEGAELQVIRGMHGLLGAKRVRELFIEIHPDRLESGSGDVSHVFGLLHVSGYRAVWTSPRGTEIHVHFRKAGSV